MMAPATLLELREALWCASYAKEVCESIIEKGRPNADAFMNLCQSLRDLEMHIPGYSGDDDADGLSIRAEEINQLELALKHGKQATESFQE